MLRLATSYLSTTSSQDTFLHLLDWSLQMCQTALLLCLSQELSCYEQIGTNICMPIHYVQLVQSCTLKNMNIECCAYHDCKWLLMIRTSYNGAKAASAWWCSDHRLRWFDWDNWILPGVFHHCWTWSSWGSVQHEGLYWDWWARQLWCWIPQLLG